MTNLLQVELGVLGPLQVRQYGLPVAIPGAKPRAILTMLGLHGGSVVSADVLVELLWGDDPPRTSAKALQTHISSLRRILGDGFVMTQGTGWMLSTTEIDATRYKLAARLGRDAYASGDTSQAVAHFDEALTLWRGSPELPDGQRGDSEKTRWIEGHAALVEDRADALLATGRAAEIVGELEAAIADAPLRERRWGQLMLALYRAGRQGEALGAYQRARSLLANELGVDPGPDLRRLEAAIVAQDDSLELPVSQQISMVMRAVTFLLTDIEGSTAAWEADAEAMAGALARHDEIVEQVVTSRGGRLVKTRGEGDATFSVFDRPSGAAAAAVELQEAIAHEPWALSQPMRIRVALHTGEVELRDGDYFGRAVNRAARLRSLAVGGQILCSGATAELVIDTLSDDVVLADLGMRKLKNLPRPEHVFELRLETADDPHTSTPDAPMARPALPAVLAGSGPFVGRSHELERLLSAWHTTLAAGTRAVLIAGEPGVGKTRLAGEWSRQAYEQGAVILYGRCDEDLGAPYQPFAEALRALVPCLDASRLRKLRGIEALLPLVPGLAEVLPDLAAPTRADPDTERYALFDAVVAVLGIASASAPVVLILDDLHWAEKPTLLLLRHLLRFGEQARVQIVGTYRSTDLDRSHPLAAMLADLHRDGSAHRLALGGLDEDDVTAYVAEAGYDDQELARALASVTGGNPFFLIEALRHVDESGGRWDPSTLPQGVREAVSRRLSRLPAETNKALAAAAVVGSRFALTLVEQVVGDDLVDAFDEACKAGIVIEEPGGRYRFNHALVRQSLLAELASVRRMRLHQRIAATLETEPGADDELLAELAYHYFECAWAGNAAKAVDYCRRAADQAMTRLAYEGAADLYDKALHALEELDEELPDRDDQQAELLIARCEALLAAGDVVSATGAVAQLHSAAGTSARLTAWGTCFDGELSVLTDPERLDEIEAAVRGAADQLAALDDAAGEAKAHTVRALCLGRLGRIGDCETALDQALTAARRARDHRLVNAVLAGAPLAALWGPNPVPRAGGRCLDVVRLLRITTGSPVVEATSTRCQGVLDAFRGRAAAGRQLIDSARRSLHELGMRHALLEVDQFAGIIELVADDAASAEPYLRRAYNGFRRMRLDADTADTAALLARACLALNKEVEADELCTESERLAGHALKASIAWRTVRAQLLARAGAHDEARQVAEEAVAIAERTDELVDHGDACLALATVLRAAGDAAGARTAAERAVDLYERKGAAALAEKARPLLGAEIPTASAAREAQTVEPDNACVRALRKMGAALARKDWGEHEAMYAPDVFVESRRKVVGFNRDDLPPDTWPRQSRRLSDIDGVGLYRMEVLAVRGERLALGRLETGTADMSPGAPRDEMLWVSGLDDEGRIALQIFFDVDDMDAALAELDAIYARFGEEQPRARRPENAASRITERFWTCFAANDLEATATLLSDDFFNDDRRRAVNSGTRRGPEAVFVDMGVSAEFGTQITSTVIATRGERLCLSRTSFSGRDQRPDAFVIEILHVIEIDADERIAALVTFEPDELAGAITELDARYLAGEAASQAHTWSLVARAYAGFNRGEFPLTTRDWVNIDHRQVTGMAPGEWTADLRASYALAPDLSTHIEAVHRLGDFGAVFTQRSRGTSQEGFEAEWRMVCLMMIEGDLINRCEVFDEEDFAALARFDELSRPVHRLENTASRVSECLNASFAARNWAAMTDILADDFHGYDRRQVIDVGLHGRDAVIESFRAAAEFGVPEASSITVATRGENLVLTRVRYSISDADPDAFHIDLLQIAEIDGDERITGLVTFDVDDFDAAFAELDVRYLAGEAAPHAHTWTLTVQSFATLNRGETPSTTSDYTIVDHQLHNEASGITGSLHASWDLTPDLRMYIEAVHALTDVGVVVTLVVHGASTEGFKAEWRVVEVLTREGDAGKRCEVFGDGDVDAALARFDELSTPTRQLDNAASRVVERYLAHFAAHDWESMAEMLAEDLSCDDRRPVVNSGHRDGRDAEIAGLHALVDIGVADISSTAIATRGEFLVLHRPSSSLPDWPEPFHNELIEVVEITADGRIAARVSFGPDDLDAAFAELDARYLAGEAAPYAHTWSVIANTYAAFNRDEPADIVNIDHRKVARFAPGDLTAASWKGLTPNLRAYIEVVHSVSNFGAVVTGMSYGTSHEGFEAEWRQIQLLIVDGNSMSRNELFDEEDLDAALARFDELSRPATRLENGASRANERILRYFAARDWDAIAKNLTGDSLFDDRRQVVNIGIKRGRDPALADMSAAADMGVTNWTSEVIATRGRHLALSRFRWSDREQEPGVFHTEALGVVEVDADERIVARIGFDPEGIDAAFTELEARYLAGEAAAHAITWSVIARNYAAFNRHEFPSTTPDWVTIDHRKTTSVEADDLPTYIRAFWDDVSDATVYIESVHRVSELGAVITQVSKGIAQGFEAEWREINLVIMDGELIARSELFDETDIAAALARFDELSRRAPRLENAASLAYERFNACFTTADWDALAETMADSFFADDRRRFVGLGGRQGRDAALAELRTVAELGVTTATSTVVATRGERLALVRTRFSGRDKRADAFHTETLHAVEIDSDHRIALIIGFDLDDIDAALAELDARYAAGEGAPYADAWSVLAGAFAAVNRREPPSTTTDSVNIDHRRAIGFAPGEMTEYLRATWEDAREFRVYIEAVHRLSHFGAVVTHSWHNTSQEGIDAEWRVIGITTVEGELINRCELYDETDLDEVLSRFDELGRPAMQLENAASRTYERFNAYLAAPDWDAMSEMIADDACNDDRRRVVSSGIQRGRDAQLANLRAVVGVGVRHNVSSTIATRGERLALVRTRVSGGDQRPEAFGLEMLHVIEIDTDNRISAGVTFDLDDIDAASAELDARYVAGEAAAHAHTWSVIAGAYASFNRHELPSMATSFVNVDHRPFGRTIEASDLQASMRAMWDLAPDQSIHVEAVHRLSGFGAVVTHTATGTSRDGFDAAWRMIYLITVEGDLINRCEIFEEADLDAALARFEELEPQTMRLENAASRVDDRFRACFAARNWDAMAESLAEDASFDDRRRVVGAGVRRGRAVVISDAQATAELGVKVITTAVLATRGEYLALASARFSGRDQLAETFHTEALGIIEIDADEQILAVVAFDLDDIDAAFTELDARYLAGEAAAHARTWSVISEGYAALNRHELPESTASDWVVIDRRRLPTFEAGDLPAYMRASWEVTPDITVYIEAVHRLSKLGAVVTHAAHGTARDGFTGDWRMIDLLTVEGGLVTRCEIFDEADLDAALTGFDDLSTPSPHVENAATRLWTRAADTFNRRDVVGFVALTSPDGHLDDRRTGVRDFQEGSMRQRVVQTLYEYPPSWRLEIEHLATRGSRLCLSRQILRDTDEADRPITIDLLTVLEVGKDGLAYDLVNFDADDVDAALQELDARYVAGEGAPYSRIWSLVVQTYAAFNRQELSDRTPNWVNIDHRCGVAPPPGDMASYVRAMWTVAPDVSTRIEAVHRLSDLGAVFTHTESGTSPEGFYAEWREVALLTFDGDLINRCELFDESDLDAALARFDELNRHTWRPENTASRVADRFCECFAARDWVSMGDTLADNVCTVDNRPVVGVGNRQGRELNVADWQAVADVGTKNLTSALIATRGDRLVLSRFVTSGRDQRPEAFRTAVLCVIETNADNRIVACVMFEADEIDAAYKELDGRYLAGEAARYADVWSVFADTYAMFNRHEIPSVANWVTIDHRVREFFAAEDLAAYIRSGWDVTPDNKMYVECVHRLSEFGAVVTHVAYGTSPEGFYAEWRMIALIAFGGTPTDRCEIFDEAEIETALAKFDELSRPTPRLENTATRVYDLLLEHHAARDYDASAEMLAEDYWVDDRRRVVNAGIRHGRDAAIADARTVTELGGTHITSDVIATRGDRLFLTRSRVFIRDEGPEFFDNQSFVIVEIGADERAVSMVVFDLEDIDAAFAELDALYLAGEAAAHARTWSVVTEMHKALNRHEPPLQAPNCIRIDHRRPAMFEMGDLDAFCSATWDLTPEAMVYVEAVHRLTDFGAVFTQVTHGSSQDGFDVEWRMVDVLTVDGDLTNRGEIFDETDLDAALARFDELARPAPRLGNAATRARTRVVEAYNRRDVETFREVPAGRYEDRRKGLRDEGAMDRNYAHAVTSETPISWQLEIEPVAIRGDRLALSRETFRETVDASRPITIGLITLTEVDQDGIIRYTVFFDIDDVDAAFEELEALYLAGEAAAHAHTWSVITEAYAAFNRREPPAATPAWVDHRLLATIQPGDLIANVHAAWDLVPDVRVHIVAVHRLSERGGVVVLVTKGNSQQGFYAEYHDIAVVTVAGDLPNRFEMFDEADLDAALARFDELSRSAHSIENAATRTWERLVDAYNRRKLDAFVALTAPDGRYHDRRKGLRETRDGSMRWRVAQTLFDLPPSLRLEAEPLAIRGSRLCLLRQALRDTDDAERSIVIELMTVLEATEEGLAHTIVNFDTDDLDAAMAELTARWIASGEVSHPSVIEVARINAEAANRHDWDTLVDRHAGATYVNHRQLASGADTVADDMSSLRMLASLVPDLSFETAEIFTHSASGFVLHTVLKGTSTDGVAIEISLVVLMLVAGDRITHAETFDLSQLELALTRFEELNTSG